MADPRAWRDFRVRVISALILVPAALLSMWLGGVVWLLALSIMVAGMGAEWAGLCGVMARSPEGATIPLCLLAAGIALWAGLPLAALLILLGGSAALALASRRAALGQGIVYIGFGYLALIFLRQGPSGWRNVLFLMLVVWASDIGAYLVGRAIGGARLAPKISPGKTWSGAVGGTLIALLVGAAAGYEYPWRAAAIALLLSLAAQAGDLLESAIKRHFGAKDSGWIIPGHGGLLDRLDGVLAAAPVAALWSMLTHPNARLWQ